MTDSSFVFEEGDPIEVGSHGDHDFVYHEGNPVLDGGQSTLVFEAGTGIGGGIFGWPEDFESGNLDKYGGDLSVFEVSKSNSYEGTYHLTAPNTSKNTFEMIHTREIQAEPPVTMGVYVGDYDRAGFSFAAQNELGASGYSGYNVSIANGGGQPRIAKWDAGSEVLLDVQQDDTLTSGYELWEIDWQSDGTITFTQYEGTAGTNVKQTISATDTTYISGGIGWSCFQEISPNYDYAHIISSS